MKITCNNKPRQFIYGYELSVKEREDFDYLNPEELDARDFVRYKGVLYDTGEFMRVTPGVANCQREGWEKFDGYFSDSFFSGVLLKYIDPDNCIMASYYC